MTSTAQQLDAALRRRLAARTGAEAVAADGAIREATQRQGQEREAAYRRWADAAAQQILGLVPSRRTTGPHRTRERRSGCAARTRGSRRATGARAGPSDDPDPEPEPDRGHLAAAI